MAFVCAHRIVERPCPWGPFSFSGVRKVNRTMYPFSFSKSAAAGLSAALCNGDGIPAPSRGWTFDELLQLAAACHNQMRNWHRDDDLNYLIEFASNAAGEIQLGESSWLIGGTVDCIVTPGNDPRFPDVNVVTGFRSRDRKLDASPKQRRKYARRRLPGLWLKLAELHRLARLHRSGRLPTGEAIDSDIDDQIESLSASIAEYESVLKRRPTTTAPCIVCPNLAAARFCFDSGDNIGAGSRLCESVVLFVDGCAAWKGINVPRNITPAARVELLYTAGKIGSYARKELLDMLWIGGEATSGSDLQAKLPNGRTLSQVLDSGISMLLAYMEGQPFCTHGGVRAVQRKGGVKI